VAASALLTAAVSWVLSAGASGVVGNRADAGLMRLVRGSDPDFVDRLARLASGAADVRVDHAAFSEWLADQRTFDLLSRLAALPEASGDAGLYELAGEYASDLLATAEEFGIVAADPSPDAQNKVAELIACTLVALWAESDPSQRTLLILLGDTTAIRQGQEQLRDLVEKLISTVTINSRHEGSNPRFRQVLPARNPVFTGRVDVLEGIQRRLTTGPVAVVAVRGLGGIGKSQVALEYAHRMRQSGRYHVVGWVRADSAVTMVEDLAAMAPLLALEADGPAGEVAAQVVAALEAKQDWLVVFDNAQKPADLAQMLPGGAGHVLITSRNRVWSGIAEQLDLEVFTRPESVTFLCQRSGRAEPEAAGKLAQELGDLPLALAQAGAYIDMRAMTIGQYLDLYRDPRLARKLREMGLDSGEYPASVARTWLLSVSQLLDEHPAAVDLLRLCAFLDPDNIDLDLLAEYAAEAGPVLAGVLGDRLERTETAGVLVGASLVTIAPNGQLHVHRLMQAVTRDQLDHDQVGAWVRRALRIMAAAFPAKPEDHQLWSVCASLAPHIEAVTGLAQSYSDLAETCGLLLSRLGIYLGASAQFNAAASTFERALILLEAASGSETPSVARILTNLGIIQRQVGDFPAAQATLERALAIKEVAYGPDHPEVAITLSNLGSLRWQSGDLTGAQGDLERALAIFETAYGPDDPAVARVLSNLGGVENQLSNLPAALAAQERALAIEETVYGPDHPEVAQTLGNIALIQQNQGDLTRARTNLERALAILEAAYGPDHPEVAVTLDNLGNVQGQLGDADAARATLEHALTIKQALYRHGHPQVAITLDNLGVVQSKLGEQPAAHATLERALAIFEAAYGPDHPQIAITLDNLGSVKSRMGDLPAACALLERAVAIIEAAYGPEHPYTQGVREDLQTVQSGNSIM
jgi:tetratricopeptide (TPR) repeat protein